MWKLASKVVGADACCRASGGAGCDVRDGTRGSCDGSTALDDLPHFIYPNLIRLGAKRSLEAIGGQKLEVCSKFAQDTQAMLFWGFSSST